MNCWFVTYDYYDGLDSRKEEVWIDVIWQFKSEKDLDYYLNTLHVKTRNVKRYKAELIE
jgi:hypothetical protein